MSNCLFNYYDDYPTCQETYVTLCVYLGESADPDYISKELDIIPTRTQFQVEGNKSADSETIREKPSAWFLESKGTIDSKDFRKHTNWILMQLVGKEDTVHKLQEMGYSMNLSCYWVSAHGHGGPMLTPDLMKNLSDFGLSIGFDIYGGDNIWV